MDLNKVLKEHGLEVKIMSCPDCGKSHKTTEILEYKHGVSLRTPKCPCGSTRRAGHGFSKNPRLNELIGDIFLKVNG